MVRANGGSTARGRGGSVALIVLESSEEVPHTWVTTCLVHDGGSFGGQVAETGGQERVLILPARTGERRLGAG